ncbi:hypothetical protein DL766_004388 [Monosporascus sp. MC13-8B]|uniref:Velvet domain-containing protein n=1 Tax=Monosporascus cannonballus TaxID=155416 RepID=A0ABY0GZ31_9PEZI|nr:hypothetical protein DL762_007436 [Monosporascus cannonballus]RYO98733.1 hypothetical protein DL763_001994 [Monosporascus cannonballus]RYP31335.1 hypothetical protein DL766_004388 [Monosporascus sp. MC13-8B]
MNQNYQPPISHHSQVLAPELPGPPAHLSGYPAHQLPPMVPQTSYHYQNTATNMHRPVPPPRRMSSSRDHIGEFNPPENGADPSKPAAADKKRQVPPKEVSGTDATRKYHEVDHQHYILHVDLWSQEGDKELNLVKQSQAQGSISATSTTSFRELMDSHNSGYGYPAIVPSNREAAYGSPAQTGYPPHIGGYLPDAYGQGYGGYAPGAGYPQQVPMQQSHHYNYPQGGFRNDIHSPMDPLASQRGSYSHDMSAALSGGRGPGLTTSQTNGMFTRNLIGSLACSAARLTDPSEKIGIWFVLQDMSVRSEGWFRLRFSFVNLRATHAGNSQGSDAGSLVKGKAKVLAQVFSEPFQVYSAKKFPGVCESTALSKCFAAQGVKIPIRKEGQDEKGKGDGKGKDDSDNDD